MKFNRVIPSLLLAVMLSACSTGTAAGTGSAASASETTPAAAETSEEETTKVSVSVKPGTLVGFKYDGVNTFRGIPYATAERFKDPEPIDSYEGGTYMALSFGPVAPQDRTLSATAEVNSAEL